MPCIAKKGKKPRPFLEEALPDLVRLVHRNPNSKNFLVKEFQKFWQSKNTGDEEEEVGTNLVSSISSPSHPHALHKHHVFLSFPPIRAAPHLLATAVSTARPRARAAPQASA